MVWTKMRVWRLADALLRRVSDAYSWCQCQMDTRGPLEEDTALKFGLRTCGLPYTGDHEHMELAKV